MQKSAPLLFVFFLCVGVLPAVENIRMVSEPSVSPDGRYVAFAWAGDIWLASTQGGTARQLTRHPAQDANPCFSPDGKLIAFTSMRTGSRQVHVTTPSGLAPKRISNHTEGYHIECWHPDGKSILTRIARDHHWRWANRFHFLKLKGRGAESVLFDAYCSDGRLSPDGKRLLFTREGERAWRKGYHGSRATQIWLYHLKSGKFTKLVHEPEESRWPLWHPDGKSFYYVAERGGVGNLVLRDLATGKERQLTHFKEDSVMYPALSKDGSTLVFRNLFDLWVLKTDGKAEPRKITIKNVIDHPATRQHRTLLKSATEVAFSNDGLEVAFIAGGDLWVMDTELRQPVQVTRTSAFERNPVFSRDGNSIFFVGEKDGQPDIWRVLRADIGKVWWQNTKFNFYRLTRDADSEGNLRLNPAGKLLAFTKGRGDLWTIRTDGKDAKLIFESWNTPQYDWSPDGKWLVYSQFDNDFNRDIWIRPLDGHREPYNLSRHPDNDSSPVWSPDGKKIAFVGRRRDTETDIYYVHLRRQDYETDPRDQKLKNAIGRLKSARPGYLIAPPSKSTNSAASTNSSKLTPEAKKELLEKLKARREAAAKRPASEPAKQAPAAGKTKDGPAKEEARTESKKPANSSGVVIDFDGLHRRLRRISIANTAESGLMWSPDSKQLAFTATIGGKKGTYTVEIPGSSSPKLLTDKTGTQARWVFTRRSRGSGSASAGSPKILWLSSGLPGSVVGNKASSYPFSARQTVLVGNRFREALNTAWRAMRDQWYDENMGGRDWDAIRTKYARMAGECPDGRTLTEVINLMLGELNGSHLGFSYRGPSYAPAAPKDEWSYQTVHLGIRFATDGEGPGVRVKDVVRNSPADRKASRVQAGEYILAINGKPVKADSDLTTFLNVDPSMPVTLKVRAGQKPDAPVREVTIRPTSYSRIRSLLYEQWVEDNRKKVEAASDGRFGYLHIARMRMDSFYRFEEELYSVASGKDGIVIDVRENGGGSTTDHLLTILTQPRHAITVPRGGGPGYPQDRKVYATWNKPVVVLCNQNSYSNAEIFSHAIKHLKRGKLVGTPTAGGVISTGSTRIMDLGTLRMPFRGWFRLSDGQDMELYPPRPHHIVWPRPGELPAGIDRQLNKAIQVLRKEVKRYQNRPQPKLIKATER